jgi:chemotaxis protein CheD
MPDEAIPVGIAEFKVSWNPDRLVVFGLGSCVGIALYDPQSRVGGMAHVMLPSSHLYNRSPYAGKFADTALVAMTAEMERAGAGRSRLVAKLVGGANMFSNVPQTTASVGLRNIAAAREKLTEMGIPILSEQVGGTQGRTVFFHLADGQLEIRRLNRSSVWI